MKPSRELYQICEELMHDIIDESPYAGDGEEIIDRWIDTLRCDQDDTTFNDFHPDAMMELRSMTDGELREFGQHLWETF